VWPNVTEEPSGRWCGRLRPVVEVRTQQRKVCRAQAVGGGLGILLLIEPTRSPKTLVLYNLVALVLANANSYLWNTLWTFRDQARHDAKEVGMFTAQVVLGIGVGSLVLWLVARGLVAYSDLSPLVVGNIAKLSSMLVGSTTSFLLLRFLVFRSKERGDRPP
jgi:putative flippase GtrA